MKKLFTLLVAMAMVSMSFAQRGPVGPVYGNPNGQMEQTRSSWIGFANPTSNFICSPESGYSENGGTALYLPAGTIGVGHQISKVTFVHSSTAVFSNYTGTPFECESYTIKIYTNPTIETITTENGSYDTLSLGTQVYTQTYNAEVTGTHNIVEVDLTTPYTIPAGTDICVELRANGASIIGLCPFDPAQGIRSFEWLRDSWGWYEYEFGNNGNYTQMAGCLAVYDDDGQGYTPMCDWWVEMYAPGSTGRDEIDTLLFDEYAELVSFRGMTGNVGRDDAFGEIRWTLTIDQMPGTDLFVEMDETGVGMFFDTTDLQAGYVYGSGGTGWEFDLFEVSQMEEMGIQFPFELCFEVEHYTGFDGSYDPNPDNNRACAIYMLESQVPDTPNPDGINENTNTVNIYPNPACNVINVENMAGAQISIYNIAGQQVMNIEAANANEKINVSNLTEGVYVVRVANGNGVSTAKVSIVR